MSNIETALQLLGIGMITVFVILFLVVFLGNSIILIVNKFMPEAARELKPSRTISTSQLAPGSVAAIVAAVKMVTGGKGNVVNIEKQ